MNRRNKLRNIVKTLSPDKVDFSVVDNELNALKKKLTDTVNIQTLDDVTRKLKQFQKQIDFEPLLKEIESIRNLFTQKAKELEATLKSKNEELVKASESRSVSQITSLSGEVAGLKKELLSLEESRAKSFEAVIDNLNRIREFSKGLKGDISTLKDGMGTFSTKEEIKALVKNTQELLDGLKSELLTRMSKIGGGAMNQQINVNSSVMSTKFADINFVSNTAIQWSASDDVTNKRVNLTASLISGGAGGGGSLTVKEADGAPNVSSVTTIVVSNGTLTDDGGGQVTISTGGGGSGITRVSSTISVSSTFANASQTDYVAFANVGIALTLPVASSGNLYTVKNLSGSSVLVLAGEGIDEGASALIPSNYESLSFISNSSIWGVV